MSVSNTTAVFAGTADIQSSGNVLTAANTNLDGTGTLDTVWTTDSNYDERLDYIQVYPQGTNVQTVLRVLLFNGSTFKSVFTEITAPATTASSTTALSVLRIPMNLKLPKGWVVKVANATAVSAGFRLTGVGVSFAPSA